ncbi:MAG: hypothetical protein J4F28_09480, partial [Nitrosopumilaceae archaeon]|nr:hypothetical protein [Nitrosopumilaceae archaeon]
MTGSARCAHRVPRRTTPRRARKPRRPAFLLTGPLMLGMMLLGFVVFTAVMTAFIGIIQANLVETLTDVPTMYEYHPDTGARITSVPGG